MSETVRQIRQTAERRLLELAPLLAEAEQLRALLAVLEAPVAGAPAAPAGPPAAPPARAQEPLAALDGCGRRIASRR